MSDFSSCFIRYSKYVNENGSENNYLENCKIYRKDYLSAMKFAEPEELALLIHIHQFAVHVEDGWALYQQYFETGGKSKDVLLDFCDFLWFWGDYDEDVTRIRKYMENERLPEAEKIAKELCYKEVSKRKRGGGSRL